LDYRYVKLHDCTPIVVDIIPQHGGETDKLDDSYYYA